MAEQVVALGRTESITGQTLVIDSGRFCHSRQAAGHSASGVRSVLLRYCFVYNEALRQAESAWGTHDGKARTLCLAYPRRQEITVGQKSNGVEGYPRAYAERKDYNITLSVIRKRTPWRSLSTRTCPP